MKRIALAQVNTSMGAIEKNCSRIGQFLEQATKKNVDLTIFSELAIIGYPPKDLLEQDGFVKKSRRALENLASAYSKNSFIVGFVDENSQVGKGRFNAAAYISEGKIQFIQHKRLLPTYDVFDEVRYFDEGASSQVVSMGSFRCGITICEDIWSEEKVLGRRLYTSRPAQELKTQGADLIVNISASPYHSGKEEVRRQIGKKLVKETNLPLVLVNLVGGNDELLFDGGSFALDSRGREVARCSVFREDLVVADFETSSGEIRTWPSSSEEWRSQALIMGIQDYVKKCGFSKVLMGLSGGIDSALVLLLAVEALGPKNVTAVFMPSPFSSQASLEDSQTMVQTLGVESFVLPITSIMSTYDEVLSEVFKNSKPDSTEENIQARIRGNLLMALSNKFGALVMSTGNKSELAVGYCTQYGDMAGGLAVISDVSKKGVYELAHYLNQKWKAIPSRVFLRPPSAELRPNQKDEDSLPPYEILDPVLQLYIEERLSIDSIVSKGFNKGIVNRIIQLVEKSEFKRRQAAPGLRLSPKAFGIGRQMPIARGSV